MEQVTCFNARLDQLAREVGGWPEGAVVHTVEVVNGGGSQKDPQVLLEGQVPTGIGPRGQATFKGAKRKDAFKAVVRLSEYRACYGATNA